MAQDSDSSLKERVIRVFISSTFRDMKEERDYLVKFVFPELRSLCEKRGVVWGEVDLRWGVSDEQVAEGKALPICLEEIRRCRPYFIGLLGERYGWVPDAIPPEVLAQEPWLRDHLEHSVTELEILHGVLRNPDMAQHAFFYLRDPAYVDTLTPEQRPDFVTEDVDSAKKLESLKDRIRRSAFPVRENYPDPKALGDLLREDLTAVIDTLFPEGSQPDPLDREAMDHAAYAQSRARVYLGRKEYYDRLDAQAAAGDDQPLVVLGESGGGKSALLANWALRYRKEHPDALLIQHYIGASPCSADWAAMLRRLMGEFKRRLGIEQDIPDKPDALRAAFPNWLHMAAAKGRVVLILDALNQLEDRDGAPDLVWLPPVMPETVRLIVSTLPGRPLDAAQKRAWPTMTVKPLDTAERKRMSEDFLAQYAKHLAPERLKRIIAVSQTANPLFLTVLLDELRQYGDHETLDECIGHYLAAETIEDLFKRILKRYEHDYECDRPGLVRATMTALWSARRGLSESELLDLLNADGIPTLQAHLSPLLLAADRALIIRSGLFTFAHDYLRHAVNDLYLATAGEQAAARLRLAEYFELREMSARRVDELPWLLAQAKEWQKLANVMIVPPFFEMAWDLRSWEVTRYWKQIEENTNVHAESFFNDLVMFADMGIVFRMADLFMTMDKYELAYGSFKILEETFRGRGDLNNAQAAVGNQAIALSRLGRKEDAVSAYENQERMASQAGHIEGQSNALVGRGMIASEEGRLDEAMELLQQAERLYKCLGKGESLQILNGLAVVCEKQGNYELAIGKFLQQLNIVRASGQRGIVMQVLGNLAAACLHVKRYHEARAHAKECEKIALELANITEQLRAISIQAAVLVETREFAAALPLLERKGLIAKDLNILPDLHSAILMRAAILAEQFKRYDEALPLAEQAVSLSESLSEESKRSSWSILATIRRRQQGIDRARGDKRMDQELVRHAAIQAVVDQVQGDRDKLVRVIRSLKDWDDGIALYRQQNCTAAIGKHEGALRTLSGIPNVGRIVALIKSALIAEYKDVGRTDDAIRVGEEAVRLLRPDPMLASDCAQALADLGAACFDAGRWATGIPHVEQARAIYGTLDNGKEFCKICDHNLQVARENLKSPQGNEKRKRSFLERLFRVK